jgi:hypothetical protein
MATVIDEEAMKLKGKGNLPFDINKPPLKPAPHQDFPKMLYRWPKDKTLHPTSKTAIAKDADEEKALKAKGWRDTPHIQEHPEDVPDGFEADDPEAEAAGGDKGKTLDAMTKAELVAHAKDVHGLEIDPGLKKDQIVQAIQDATGKAN